MTRFLATVLSLPALSTVLLAQPVCAQQHLPFPMDVVSDAGSPGVVELAPRDADIRRLSAFERLTLTDVPLPGGPVDIELERVALNFSATEVYVDGELDPGGLPLDGMSLWMGHVQGREDLAAVLGFSPHGSHGWIETAEGRINLIAGPSADGGWGSPVGRFVTEEELLAIGPGPLASCNVLEPPGRPSRPGPSGSEGAPLPGGGLGETLECPIAVETDYQLFQVFGSLQAEQAYVTLLIGAVSARFHQQVNVILTYPYLGFYTDPDDPWTTQDSGDCGVVLTEFRDAWAGNIPNGAALGHFLSGAFLGCGVAWVDTLCNPDYGFSLSCCINGGVSFPVTQGSNTWDFFVMAHELGHNFGTGHTQDYCPPLDTCVANCTGTEACTSSGTNMSYCHGCPGGMNNITTYFHPTVVNVLRNHALTSCLPNLCQIENYCVTTPNSAFDSGAIIGASGSTSVTANHLVLIVANAVPEQFALFYYGPEQAFVPFGDGIRCVGAGALGTFRLPPPAVTGSFGDVVRPVDLTEPPSDSGPGAIVAGATWNFQLWFRDPAAGGAGFNFSDGLSVSFCP